MKKMIRSKTMAVAIGTLSTVCLAQAGVVSVNFTNGDGPRLIRGYESTGVEAAKGWTNVTIVKKGEKKVSGNTQIGKTGIKLEWTASSPVVTCNTSRDAGNPDKTDGFLALFESGLVDFTPRKKSHRKRTRKRRYRAPRA